MLGIVQCLIQKQEWEKNQHAAEKYKRPVYDTWHKNVVCGHFYRSHNAKGMCRPCRQRFLYANKKILSIVVYNLNKIGLQAVFGNVSDSFLSGVKIENGTLIVDRSCSISNLLHEAGHLAVLPKEYRVQANDDLSIVLLKMYDEVDCSKEENRRYMQCEDAESTAWAYAFGLKCGVPFDLIIDDEQYDGTGRDVLESLKHGSGFGVNGLARMGWCASSIIHSKASGLPIYPNLVKWIND